jgi:hypothetical protein
MAKASPYNCDVRVRRACIQDGPGQRINECTLIVSNDGAGGSPRTPHDAESSHRSFRPAEASRRPLLLDNKVRSPPHGLPAPPRTAAVRLVRASSATLDAPVAQGLHPAETGRRRWNWRRRHRSGSNVLLPRGEHALLPNDGSAARSVLRT